MGSNSTPFASIAYMAMFERFKVSATRLTISSNLTTPSRSNGGSWFTGMPISLTFPAPEVTGRPMLAAPSWIGNPPEIHTMFLRPGMLDT